MAANAAALKLKPLLTLYGSAAPLRWYVSTALSLRIVLFLRSPSSSFLEFFVYCCSKLHVDDLRLLVIVLWHVWFLRNKLIHEQVTLAAKDIVSWSICFLSDFDAANVPLPCCPVYKNSVKWKRPPTHISLALSYNFFFN
ncbi:hypothetical protein ACOSQ3_015122 [Xanthoceras sorbifolium]